MQLEGKDNILCRISKINGYFEGSINSLMNLLTGKDIYIKSDCKNCPNYCKIIAHQNSKTKNITNSSHLLPHSQYNKLNFQQINFKRGEDSFRNFLKFEKIKLENTGKLLFKNKTIIPIEIGCLHIIYQHYHKTNNENLFKENVIKGAEQIADYLFNSPSTDKKIKLMHSMITAFGWGISHHTKNKKNIHLNLINFPFSKYPPFYQIFVINGYLNNIFKRKFIFKEFKENLNPYSLKLKYSLN